MNSYASLRKQNRSVLTTVVSLLLCVVLSATMLFSRLTAYATEDTRHYIPLTESGGLTVVQPINMENTLRAPGQPPLLAASPFLTANWFRVTDQNGAWKGRTDIEIFRISYENGAGKVTVNSSDGDKLLAPGTENEYTFALENTCNENVKYEMTMEAYFTDGTHAIPVEARVFDHKGNYLAGSENGYADVLALNVVADSGTLKPGYVMPYTLQWQWPFEEDDTYDTMLGNLAVDEDIMLTIVINTVASYTPTADGGIPKTGDSSHVMFYAGVMVTSAAALLVLFFLTRRKREEEDAK